MFGLSGVPGIEFDHSAYNSSNPFPPSSPIDFNDSRNDSSKRNVLDHSASNSYNPFPPSSIIDFNDSCNDLSKRNVLASFSQSSVESKSSDVVDVDIVLKCRDVVLYMATILSGCGVRMVTGLGALCFTLSWGLSLLAPGSTQHLAHAVWYVTRALTFEEEVSTVSYGDVDRVIPVSWWDVIIFPLISLGMAIPRLDLLDYAWLPLMVHLAMGYPTRVWYVVLNGAFLCMALSFRPEILYVGVSLLWGSYRGHRRWCLLVAAVVHGCFCWTTSWDVVSLMSGVLAAEAKFRMMSDPYGELEVLSYLSVCGFFKSRVWMWNLVPVLSMPSLFGWRRRWRYTDKVWLDMDIIIVACILLVAYVLYTER